MSDDDAWAALADAFVEGAYATVKGQVRTYVLHQHLLRHLPAPPASVLDVGGGAAHQSLPLARLGYDVTVLDPSEAMLAKARQRVATESEAVRDRVRFIQAEGEKADGETFDVVLCHGVLMYLDQPEPMLDALCRSLAPGGLLSIMALNARTLAVRPAIEQRWDEALAAFDAATETGVFGTSTRADTVDHLSQLMRDREVDPVAWYGVWLFTDWRDPDPDDLEVVAAVELQASLRDPYRGLSRVFHLLGHRR
ncbi:methyltransferase [Actinokineospora enzanensis]|uniref:methyltransferase n=1 Tax=Actinokineospora enzanensis TaxID=155975 RepID=UPI0003783F51|nr:methyltransferase [Actinokineospora enzanensis]